MLLNTQNPNTKTNYNKPVYGQSGKYTLSPGTCLPYFIVSMEIERALEELKIAEQMSPDINRQWSLNELFQREVDRDRVKSDLIEGYLADPHKLKFFNAITIVLMPKDGDSFKLEVEPDKKPAIPWSTNDKNDEQWATWESLNGTSTTISGVQYTTIGTSARLRWDLDQIHAVAVDGQHRLTALQNYKHDYKSTVFDKDEKETTIPVIFLLLSEAFGLRSKDNTTKSIKLIARELFTDLNKNAKNVDNARQLVLDDWDLTARCVKELVTNETSQDSHSQLPLTLVRWQDAINRFDSSYYLNSLVHLQSLVEIILDLPTIKPMDYQSVTSYIQDLGDLCQNDLLKQSLLEHYNTNYCDEQEPQTPFRRLPYDFLEKAVISFTEVHRPYMIRTLTELRPYKNLLEYARSENLIEGDFGKWHSQTKAHRERIKQSKNADDNTWFSTNIDRHVKHIESMKTLNEGKDADWAFKAIFQKALIALSKDVEFDYKGLIGDLDKLINILNTAHINGIFNVLADIKESHYKLWTFIAINPGNEKIKVSQKVEKNILSALRTIYYINLKIEFDLNQEDSTLEINEVYIKKLIKFFDSKKSMTEWPHCNEMLKDIRNAFDTSPLFKAHSTNTQELSPQEEASWKNAVVEDRLFNFIKTIIIFPLDSEDVTGQ